MAHHGSDLSGLLRDEAQKQRFGPTGKYPDGKLNENDEGEIQIGVAADTEHQKVILNFGVPVAWIGFTAEQALELADSLRQNAFESRGIMIDAPGGGFASAIRCNRIACEEKANSPNATVQKAEHTAGSQSGPGAFELRGRCG